MQPTSIAHSGRKFSPTKLLSHSLGGEPTGSQEFNDRPGMFVSLMYSCPHLDVYIGRVQVPCLINTGIVVSKVTGSFFS